MILIFSVASIETNRVKLLKYNYQELFKGFWHEHC